MGGAHARRVAALPGSAHLGTPGSHHAPIRTSLRLSSARAVARLRCPMALRATPLLYSVLLAFGCRRNAQPSSDTAVASSSARASGSATALVVPPPDREALRSACEEQARVRVAAEDRYWGVSTRPPRDIGREALPCIAQAALPGSGLTAAAIRECARAENELATRSLALWGATADRCPLRGRLESGAACSHDAQCASGHCLVARGAVCGACGAPLPSTPGDPCSVDRCAPGLECNGRVCVRPRSLGGACDAAAGCSGEGSCVGGKCVPRARKGERCNDLADLEAAAQAPACEPGLDCGPRHTCVERTPVKARTRRPGESCEKPGDECEQGECKVREEVARCIPYRLDGASCDPDEDACLPPAFCSRVHQRCEFRGAHVCE
jgi:hypothetical protein